MFCNVCLNDHLMSEDCDHIRRCLNCRSADLQDDSCGTCGYNQYAPDEEECYE